MNTRLDDLPGDLRRIAEVAGIEAATALRDAFPGELLAIPNSRPSAYDCVDIVIATVCRHWRVTPRELLGPSRIARIVWPRMIGMYLCVRLRLPIPYQQIARAFGRGDRSTVNNAVETVEQRRKQERMSDSEIAAVLDELTQLIDGSSPTPTSNNQ